MARLWLVILLALLLEFSDAKPKTITDEEISAKKADCLADINSGLWGTQCKSSNIAKHNCVLRCVSGRCYDIIYGDDPLEEGEIDRRRGNEFKNCLRRQSRGDDISRRGFMDD